MHKMMIGELSGGAGDNVWRIVEKLSKGKSRSCALVFSGASAASPPHVHHGAMERMDRTPP